MIDALPEDKKNQFEMQRMKYILESHSNNGAIRYSNFLPLLNLPNDATDRQVKSAIRKLVLLLHPDKLKIDDPVINEKIKIIFNKLTLLLCKEELLSNWIFNNTGGKWED